MAKTSGKKKSVTPAKFYTIKKAGKKIVTKRHRRSAPGTDKFSMEIPPKKSKTKPGTKGKK
jgi:hypothetical protein